MLFRSGVRAGLTALPSAAADAAGGLAISDAGGLDLDTKLANTNEVTAVRMATLTDWINGGRLDLLLDAIKAVTDLLPDAGALTTIGTDTARLTAARAAILTDWINGGRLDLLLDAIPTTAMRGTDNAALAAIATEARLAELDAANLPADIDSILADTGTDGVVLKAAGLNADAVDKILDEVVEGAITFRQALRLFLAVLTGKSSGGGTATLAFRDIGDSKNRISATVDADGNRTAIGTRDGS